MLCSNQLSYVATNLRNLEGRKLSLPSADLSIGLPPIRTATRKKRLTAVFTYAPFFGGGLRWSILDKLIRNRQLTVIAADEQRQFG